MVRPARPFRPEPGDPWGGGASPGLPAAAVRVLDRFAGSSPDPHRRAIADALAVIVAAAGPGANPESVRSRAPGELLLRRALLDRLRAELLSESSEDTPTSEELVELLRRLERVREALDPDGNDDFEACLLGPNGLGLSVGVTHDLRSPLSAVLLLSDSLRLGIGGELEPPQKRQVGLIHSAARSMLSMVNDAIDHFGPAGPAIDREACEFSVREVIQSVSEIVGPLAQQKGLSLVTASPEGDARKGYPVALGRVLLNLASNAVKFTDEGFVEIRAHARGSESVRFGVRDSGPGIPDGVRDDLWRTFRLPDRQGGLRFSASGLGLSVARTLVESMGATLECETRMGEGTVFSFTLELPRV